ncbi:hypothetical protein K437DRAFT_258482 [Tilletiaria anomala UBC 951]|uniref:Uncharacterized protein n=1 Tax=Tilletiaria anomala (strain ATCC 24038 / CBS 436.72 / UBC 951) TaxID=1037660 RepID=A0A066VL03_TILAU|nr:uncharacterized protein K437DRAFT_258482 [Tilletiaria anomala UBC 951]KDN40978.1 hypothetical protein K437DRAFT_258482 [Tilletiaria anomala UBC 951]
MSTTFTTSAIGEALTVKAEDGFPLAAHIFRPQDPSTIRAILVTANATGVHARFYHDFSRWAAQHCVLAFTFDYRYSGSSFPEHTQRILTAAKARGEAGEDEYNQAYDAALRECPESEDLTQSWGRKDLKAIVLHAREECARLMPGGVARARQIELTIMGHSLGGHLHVLLEPEFVANEAYPSSAVSSNRASSSSTRRVNRFMTVCSGNAHWRNHPTSLAARFAMEELVARPLVEEKIFRCVNIGLGFDLPYGPGSEWLEWYFHPLFSLARPDNECRARENTRTTPFMYFGFVDDETMGPEMMERYLTTLDCSTSRVQSLRINPRVEPNWPRCAHVNAFQSGNGTGFTDSQDGDKATRGGEAYMPSHGAAAEGKARDRGVAQQLAEVTLSREKSIWPIFLAWIVHGETKKEVGEYRMWSKSDERDRDALREEEKVAREQEANEGQRGYLTGFDEGEEVEKEDEGQSREENSGGDVGPTPNDQQQHLHEQIPKPRI